MSDDEMQDVVMSSDSDDDSSTFHGGSTIANKHVFIGKRGRMRGQYEVLKHSLADTPSAPDDDGLGKWEGMAQIGGGGYGKALVFARFDQNDKIRDRMIVKEVAFTRKTWWDPTQWVPRDPPKGWRDLDSAIDRHTNIEYHVHKRLDDGGTDLFPALRGQSNIDKKNWRWRIYSEWCPLSTITDVIRDYVREARRARIESDAGLTTRGYTDGWGELIPE